MSEAATPMSAQRVCPRCGTEAADQRFCGGCGLNLARQTELPDAEEYAARLRQEQWLRTQGGTVTAGASGDKTALAIAREAETAPLADWGVRFGAFVIDWLILLIPAVLVFVMFGLFALLVWPAAYFGYFLLMVRESQNGQSVGMQLLGIRVRRVNGQPVDAGTVAIRQLLMQCLACGLFGFLTLWIFPLLNYLWPVWDSENRAIHDMVAKTRVVRA